MPEKNKATLLTENQALRQRLDELEARLAASDNVLAYILDALIISNLQFVVTGWNRAAEQLYGWTAAEAIGRSLVDLLQTEYPAGSREAAVQRIAETGEWSGEVTQQRKDGTRLPVWSRVAALRDVQGVLIGYAGINRDLTDRHNAEMALRQAHDELEMCVQQRTAELTQANAALQASQTTLQAFYDSAPFMMGVAELDRDRLVAVTANPATTSFLALQLEDAVGREGMVLRDSPGIERLLVENCRRCLQAGAPVRFESDYPHPSGLRWLDVSLAFIGRNASGNPQFSFVADDITDRKSAQVALGESETRLRQVLESTLDIVFAIDRDYRLLINNQRHQQALIASGGHPFEPGESVLSPDYPPELRALWLAAYDRALGGEEFKMETEWADLDGLPHTNENNFSPLRNTSGAITGVLVVVHDVTNRKHVEAALRHSNETLEQRVAERTAELRESEERFSRAFHANPAVQLISRVDNGRILDVNAACCRTLGLSRSELIGRNAAELDFWADSKERQQEIQAARRAGGPGPFEINVRHTSGEIRTLVASSEPLEFSGLKALIVTAIDITQRKRDEAQVVYQANLLANVNDAIIAADPNFVITAWNKAAEKIYGWKAEEAIGQYGPALLKTEVVGGTLEAVVAQVQSTGETIAEIIHTRKDGEKILVETHATVIRDANNQAIGRVSVNHDITGRRRAADALKLAHEELREAHLQLQNLSRQLIETQERERRVVGRELHDEIGQTLTGLKILLEVAQRLPADNSRQKLAQAQQVTDELIDRTSALSLNLRLPMLDDMGLLPALVWFMDRYTSQTNIQVGFRHAGIVNRRFTSAIETAVYRLVQEALTNVARHARVSAVVVQITASETELDVLVKDRGQGFDLQAVLDRKVTGGLSGMRERVRLLSGELEIDSAPGQGTQIYISLPLGQEP